MQTLCRDSFETGLTQMPQFSSYRLAIDLDEALQGAAKIAAPGKMFPVVAAKNLRRTLCA